jgi:hypothetical protein
MIARTQTTAATDRIILEALEPLNRNKMPVNWKTKPPLKVALIALAALAILWTACYIWRRNTSADYESHSEMIIGPDLPSK